MHIKFEETTIWKFPKNKYISEMNEMTWYMDHAELEISADNDVLNKYVKEIIDEALGLGPLEDMLSDKTITEIMVVGPKKIYFEKISLIFCVTSGAGATGFESVSISVLRATAFFLVAKIIGTPTATEPPTVLKTNPRVFALKYRAMKKPPTAPTTIPDSMTYLLTLGMNCISARTSASLN